MIGLTSLVIFLMAVLIICVTPGPDMLFILSRGLTFGTRAGVLSALGMSAGMVVHTTAVSLGLAAVLKSSTVAYDTLRYAGAAYLLVMAWRSLRRPSTTELAVEADFGPSSAKVFGQAVLTNLLNPKIVLFYLAFLPQFVRPSAGRAGLQLLVLGLVFTTVGLLVDLAVAFLASRIRRLLRRRGHAQVWLSRVSGLVLVGLAVRIALT